MSDIMEWLRDSLTSKVIEEAHRLDEAADEIERLRRDNERLRVALTASCGEGDRFESSEMGVCPRAAKAEAGNERLRALLEEIHGDGRTPSWILQKIEALNGTD